MTTCVRARFAVGFMYLLGGLGIILLDRSQEKGQTATNRTLFVIAGFLCTVVAYNCTVLFLKMKMPGMFLSLFSLFAFRGDIMSRSSADNSFLLPPRLPDSNSDVTRGPLILNIVSYWVFFLILLANLLQRSGNSLLRSSDASPSLSLARARSLSLSFSL